MVRHALVRALLAHYLERAGYGGTFRLTLNADRFAREARRLGYVEQRARHKFYAESIPRARHPLVWINLAMHRSVRDLADSCAHEATHLADPNLPHGAEFTRRVRLLIRGEP